MRPVLVRAEKRVKEWSKSRCPELYQRHSIEDLMALRHSVLADHPELKHQISQIRIEVIRRALVACGYSHNAAEQLSREGFEVFIEARHEVELFNETEDCLGSVEKLPEILRQIEIDEVVFALNGDKKIVLTDYLNYCRRMGLLVRILPSLWHADDPSISVEKCQTVPFGSHPSVPVGR